MRRLTDSAAPRLGSGTYVCDSALGQILREIWDQQHNDTRRLSMLCDAAVERAHKAQELRGRFWAHLTRALLDHQGRPVESSLADLAAAQALVDKIRDPRAARLATICEATLLMHSGRHAAALARFNDMPLLGKPGRDDADDYFVLRGRASCAIATGAIEAGFDALYASLHVAQQAGPVAREWSVAVELAQTLISIDRPDDGLAVLENLLAVRAAPTESLQVRASVHHLLAMGKMLKGDHDHALQDLQTLIDDEFVKGSKTAAIGIRHDMVRVCIAQARMADAWLHLQQSYEDAQALGSAVQLGTCHYHAALLARADGCIAEAIELLEQALACFERDPFPAGCAPSHKEAAELLTDCHAQAGQYEQAYACHRRFFDLYRCRVDYLARGQDAAARCKQSQAGTVEMSVREIDCLRWCAAGKTAWETGQILNLSEWTVVYHLERVKRKFGLNRKQQVVARAISLGLIQPMRAAA